MLAALALMPTTLAVAPTDFQGQEPVRVYRSSPATQAAFIRSDRWQTFQAGEGKGWTAQIDELTGVPHRMWGATDLGRVDSEAALQRALEEFAARHAELLGAVHPLHLRNISTDPDFGITYAEYDVLIQGRPVWRGGLGFRVRDGSLVLVGANTYPHTPLVGSFELSADAAIRAAVRATPVPTAEHQNPAAQAVWLPLEEQSGLVLRAAYEVRTSTLEPRGEWVTHVDAETGDFLASYNEVRFLAGEVHAEHDVRHPGSGMRSSPVEGAWVSTDTDLVTTDANGAFDIEGNSPVTVLQGEHLFLSDLNGDRTLELGAGDTTWTATGDGLAALDTWIFTTQVRNTWNAIVPNLGWTDGDTEVFVNHDESCNAYYDGTLNFYTEGSGCANTGRLADVVYHEWGHGLHVESLRAGTFDGALSEGVGDVVSFLMTGDHRLAPGFFTNGGVLRDADNSRRYPDDLVGEVHEDGMIFAGAMWDTRERIAAERGEEVATEQTKRILAGLVKGGPGLEGAMSEALLADDDDNDLSNGTPNECSIVTAFAAHGLALAGNGGFGAGHTAFSTTAAGTPIPIEATLIGPLRCLEQTSFEGTVTWRVNGGDWQEDPISAAGPDILGSIPAQPEGAFVEYYLEVPTSLAVLEAPTGGWRNPFSVYVGDAIPIHCDDFEDSSGNYSHELVSGEPGDGADDWQRGRPFGKSGDPRQAHSGEKVWGNDLGRTDFDGAYQNDKHNRLSSPALELGHYDGAFLQYWRWLRVEDSVFDHASIVVNGETVWTNADGSGQDHHLDEQWVSHTLPIPQGSDTATVSFDIQSDGGLTMGGWTIDDVCLMAPPTRDNRLGVNDFEASGEDGGVRLTWTNPRHAPLSEVRVVRRPGRCPTDVTDGRAVFYDNAPELGAAMDVLDPTPSAQRYCYGVFTGDGVEYLGFAVEGWNVDEGEADSRATTDEIDEAYTLNGLDDFAEDHPALAKGGCGCASSSGLPFAPALLGLLLVLRRRD